MILQWHLKKKGPKRSKRSRISGPYIPYGLFQTKGETCAKFDSDRFRNVNLYKFHTYLKTNKNELKKPFQYRYRLHTMTQLGITQRR
jgi:hypothetical protein